MFRLKQLFTEEEDPFAQIKWEKTNITTKDKEGNTIYECLDAEFPADWSDESRQVVASKYFKESRTDGTPETSIRSMILRVVEAITSSGIEQGYFIDDAEAKVFRMELTYILVHQLATFNSPVWFNVGVAGVKNPQVSACFINSIVDDMSSILDLAKVEGMIFKDGSGSGVNLSPLRASTEKLKGGGTASGPVSFMQGYDAFANVILSGGRMRRAARMVMLDADHPDIEEFIACKAKEERIVEVLAEGGITPEWNDPESAYIHAKHQSGNNSVRLTDEFMQNIQEIVRGYRTDVDWKLTNRVGGETARTVSTKALFTQIAKAAHSCGDPGVQFHDTINNYNTCSGDGEITGSNPCSEFLWLKDSACNLASINLDRFLVDATTFNTSHFKHVINVMVLAQDILVELGSYPTKAIRKNSVTYRPLGLGYANLGGLLMHMALPYDSDTGRNVAASITSLMTAQAYLMSSYIAARLTPFSRYESNQSSMADVIDLHYSDTKKLNKDILSLQGVAVKAWQDVTGIGLGRRKSVEQATGFRNAQVTLLAPTGTTGFMMGVATTGIEPDISLQKTKSMVGGGLMTYVNPNAIEALRALEYSEEDIATLYTQIQEKGHLEDTLLATSHLPIFDCALNVPGQIRHISVEGHIGMVAAVQPFLSGAVSKTFNMPHEASVKDVERALLRAWEMKLKCVALYRRGSKMSEPLRITELKQKTAVRQVPQRIKPPEDLPTHRHGFQIGTHHGYFHIGLNPETKEPMELFIRVARFGSTVGGLLDSYATLFSKALQYGIPLEELISHMEGSKFPPSGVTKNPDIQMAQSIMDYTARWLRLKFLETSPEVPVPSLSDIPDLSEDTCPTCGHPLVRTGTCTTCRNCSYNSGVCG